MQYSKELRDAVLRRLLPPKNESISTIASQAGITEQTLRNWLNEASEDGGTSPPMRLAHPMTNGV